MQAYVEGIRLEPLRLKNSKGKDIVLTEKEREMSHIMSQQMAAVSRGVPGATFKNALAYDIIITSLTTIRKKISEQKFFTIPGGPANYLPFVVGEGAYSDILTTYRSFDIADQWETGILDMGAENQRIASADAGVDALNVSTVQWAKSIGWTLIQLEQAAKSGNWDLISAKEKARKRNWDLGVQRIAFLGANGLNGTGGSLLGLLNQPGITTNTSVITKPIGSMSPSELKTFVGQIVEEYRTNNNRTAYPTHFIIPESDWNSMPSQASSDFPIRSTINLLEEAFQEVTKNQDFQILPLAYADGPYHPQIPSITGQQVYTLLNYDEESLVMNVPLDYTSTMANSLNNFQFQNIAYGQITGVLPLRPLEMMYFTFATPSPFV